MATKPRIDGSAKHNAAWAARHIFNNNENVRRAAAAALNAETERKEGGAFDGLFGQFDNNTSQVLRDTLSDLRDYLLAYCKNDEVKARSLLSEHEPTPGYRNVTPVPDDIALVLRLLNSYRSLSGCTPGRYAELMYGERDRKRQAGTRGKRGSRMPTLDNWLDRAKLGKSNDELWQMLPQSEEGDDLYRDADTVTEVYTNGKQLTIKRAAFDKRVTAARNRR
jgi:hypothetical protein